MYVSSPFQLLELNVISAQDLAKASRSMKTYAVAWVHSDRKLTTRIDAKGGSNPTWNDKFVFRVDNEFLHSDTSAIMIQIYAVNKWFRDSHVGTIRVLVGNLIPPHNRNHIGMRFVALQVRRPSGRPQGILNVGVTILNNTRRSMPLCTQFSSSAVGFQKLMGQDEPTRATKGPGITKQRQLCRSKSDKSSFLGLGASGSLLGDDALFFLPKPNRSLINASETGRNAGKNNNNKKGKVIYDKPLSIIEGAAPSDLSLAVKLKAQEGKTDSVVGYSISPKKSVKRAKKVGSSVASRSDVSNLPLIRPVGNRQLGSEVGTTKMMNENDIESMSNVGKRKPPYYKGGYPVAKDFAAGSVWSESEVGPSPSEVAAAIAEDNKYRQFDDGGSSMLDGRRSMPSEGVWTKLERWRMDMPRSYDQYSGTSASSSSIFRGQGKTRRRPAVAVPGRKFSCFGNICGYECSIVCGSDVIAPKHKGRGANKRAVARAPSIDSVSTYF